MFTPKNRGDNDKPKQKSRFWKRLSKFSFRSSCCGSTDGVMTPGEVTMVEMPEIVEMPKFPMPNGTETAESSRTTDSTDSDEQSIRAEYAKNLIGAYRTPTNILKLRHGLTAKEIPGLKSSVVTPVNGPTEPSATPETNAATEPTTPEQAGSWFTIRNVLMFIAGVALLAVGGWFVHRWLATKAVEAAAPTAVGVATEAGTTISSYFPSIQVPSFFPSFGLFKTQEAAAAATAQPASEVAAEAAKRIAYYASRM